MKLVDLIKKFDVNKEEKLSILSQNKNDALLYLNNKFRKEVHEFLSNDSPDSKWTSYYDIDIDNLNCTITIKCTDSFKNKIIHQLNITLSFDYIENKYKLKSRNKELPFTPSDFSSLEQLIQNEMDDIINSLKDE